MRQILTRIGAPRITSPKSRGAGDFYAAVNFVRLRAVDLVPIALAGNLEIVPPARSQNNFLNQLSVVRLMGRDVTKGKFHVDRIHPAAIRRRSACARRGR